MSYETRREQRNAMLATAFHDEFSLMNPDASKRKYKSLDKAVDIVNAAVLHRRSRNKERDTAITLARTKSAALNPALLLELAIEEQRAAKAEGDFVDIQTRYKHGGHVLGTTLKEEKKNIYLEADMHLKAATIITDSDAMKDFETMHIGEVAIPPPTEEELKALQQQREIVLKLSERNELYVTVHKARAHVSQTTLNITQFEDEAASILQEVQKYRDEHDFDWSLAKNNYVRELKAKVVELKKELVVAKSRVENLLQEARSKFPDMEFEVQFKFS